MLFNRRACTRSWRGPTDDKLGIRIGRVQVSGSMTGRSCNMYFPKLRHWYFLTALHGWLLVAGPSVDTSSPEDGEGFRAIFFHPFSRTMVILPYLYLPHGIDKYDLLFDFTAPPTSPNASSSSSNSESTGRGGRARASMEKSNGHPATTRISTI